MVYFNNCQRSYRILSTKRGIIILAAVNVSVSYGKNIILQNVDFTATAGMGTAILGRNGSGKSTFLKTLGGVRKPSQGKVLINGSSVFDNAARKNIGFIPQNDITFHDLSVMDNLVFWGALNGIGKNAIADNEIVRLLGLNDSFKTKAGKLSGGSIKRLCIAASLLHNPSLLILDEPFSGIDIVAKMELVEYLSALKENGKTLVVTSHDASELIALCDKFCFVFDKSIETMENTEEFKTNPEKYISKTISRRR